MRVDEIRTSPSNGTERPGEQTLPGAPPAARHRPPMRAHPLHTLLTLGSLAGAAAAQADFGDPQIISNEADGAWSVCAADLDGDGDSDVLCASFHDDKIGWFENSGGSLGPLQVISDQADGAWSVFPADLDGDGDIDALSASSLDDTVGWHENLGGGNFAARATISSLADGADCVFAADLDGDGDADVLCASLFDHEVAWYENLGGGNFGPQQIINDDARGARSVVAADLDGDGDADVLSASEIDHKLAWYENLGGDFGPEQVISDHAHGARSIHAADVDGDGDLDALAAATLDGTVAWYPNHGGGLFGAAQLIGTGLAGIGVVRGADFDGDGDLDVAAGANHPAAIDETSWFENLGAGSFGPRQAIGDGALGLWTADLDLDGDLDLLSASPIDDRIVWIENLMQPCVNGRRYCTAAPNSAGGGALILTAGRASLTHNDLVLDAVGGVAGELGLFFYGPGRGEVPFGDGVRCVGGAITRLNPPQTFDAFGDLSRPLDLTAPPANAGAGHITALSTWHFQLWYRDPIAGGAGFNLSDALEFTFCP